MESGIYLDNCATCSDSRFAVVDDYANPNSLHFEGLKAKQEIEKARLSIAEHMKLNNYKELIFTSGATESNNMAI